jgi:hypothetical protein
MDPSTAETRLIDLIKRMDQTNAIIYTDTIMEKSPNIEFDDKRKEDEKMEGAIKRVVYTPVDTYKFTAVINMPSDDWAYFFLDGYEESLKKGVHEYVSVLGPTYFPNIYLTDMIFSDRKLLTCDIGLPERSWLSDHNATVGDIEMDILEIVNDILEFSNTGHVISTELKLVSFDKRT